MIEKKIGMLSGTEVRKLFGITRSTLCRYAASGKLHPTKISSKIVLYREDEVYAMLGAKPERKDGVATYSRVSKKGVAAQQELRRQQDRLQQFASARGMCVSHTYYDMAKSNDFSRASRRGLYGMMSAMSHGQFGAVIVESPCRVAYMGHELFELYAAQCRVQILYLSDQPAHYAYAEELAEELADAVRAAKMMLDFKPND